MNRRALLLAVLVGLIFLVWLVLLVRSVSQPAQVPQATPEAITHTILVPLFSNLNHWQRGMGYAGYGVPLVEPCSDLRLTGAQWFYNWWYTEGPVCSPRLPFVPMVWDETAVISATTYLTGPGWLLGFNEPNLPSQADMTPTLAFQLWPYLEGTGRKLVSPAVFASTNCPGCGTWLEEWWSLCQARTPSCRVDAIALHWYGCDTVMLEAYLQRRAQQFPGLPLWLTEWGCNTGTEAEQAAYTSTALPIIQRYTERNSIFSLYPYEHNRGLVIGGQLNLIGLAYSGRGPQPYPAR